MNRSQDQKSLITFNCSYEQPRSRSRSSPRFGTEQDGGEAGPVSRGTRINLYSKQFASLKNVHQQIAYNAM
jgi:hypothetical protein